MQQNKLEFWVGILVLFVSVTVCALFIKIDLGFSTCQYRVTLSQADGMGPGTPVKVHGVTVGQVTSIHLNEQYEIDVVFNIKSQYQFPTDSIVEATLNSVLGASRNLSITPGEEESCVPPGGKFMNVRHATDLFSMFQNVLELISSNK